MHFGQKKFISILLLLFALIGLDLQIYEIGASNPKSKE